MDIYEVTYTIFPEDESTAADEVARIHARNAAEAARLMEGRAVGICVRSIRKLVANKPRNPTAEHTYIVWYQIILRWRRDGFCAFQREKVRAIGTADAARVISRRYRNGKTRVRIFSVHPLEV